LPIILFQFNRLGGEHLPVDAGGPSGANTSAISSSPTAS
jgi:hypothetical protein